MALKIHRPSWLNVSKIITSYVNQSILGMVPYIRFNRCHSGGLTLAISMTVFLNVITPYSLPEIVAQEYVGLLAENR